MQNGQFVTKFEDITSPQIFAHDKIEKNTLVCIVLVFAKKTHKEPVLDFATALPPFAPKQLSTVTPNLLLDLPYDFSGGRYD